MKTTKEAFTKFYSDKASEAKSAALEQIELLKKQIAMAEAPPLKAGDSSNWPAVWAGAISSGFGKFALNMDWTGGAPHPWWTGFIATTGSSWDPWLTATFVGAGEFFVDPNTLYGKDLWFYFSGIAFGGGPCTCSVYMSNGGAQVGQFTGVVTGVGGAPGFYFSANFTNGPT